MSNVVDDDDLRPAQKATSKDTSEDACTEQVLLPMLTNMFTDVSDLILDFLDLRKFVGVLQGVSTPVSEKEKEEWTLV